MSSCVDAVGIAAFALLLTAPGQGVGRLECLADYPLPAWLAALGARVLLFGGTTAAETAVE